jgi:hypothetical protein
MFIYKSIIVAYEVDNIKNNKNRTLLVLSFLCYLTGTSVAVQFLYISWNKVKNDYGLEKLQYKMNTYFALLLVLPQYRS